MYKQLCLLFLTTSSLISAHITWSPPENISDLNLESYYESIALDPSGNAVALWTSYNQPAGLLQLYAATKLLGQPWIPDGPISPSTMWVGNGALAVDLSGNALVVWVGNISGTEKFYAVTKLFGNIWSAISEIAPVQATDYVLAIDPSSTARVIWYVQSPGLFQVWVSESTFSGGWGSWSAPQLLSGASTGSIYPDMAIDPSGNTVAVWEDSQTIVAAIKPFGGAWVLPATTISTGANNFAPHVAVDPMGNAVAIWASYSGVQAATKLFGQPWSSPYVFPGSTTDPNANPQVAIDPTGNAIATWGQGGVLVATKLLGQSWSTNIIGPGGPSQIAIDQCGNAIIGAGSVVYSRPAGQPHWVSSTSGVGAGLAINPCGHIMTIGEGTQGNPTNILAAEGYFSTTPANISGLKGQQKSNDFGTVQELFNHIQWNINSSPLVVGYNIYRNSILIETVGSSVHEYYDHNKKEGSSTTYGVAGLSFDGSEGPITNIIVR